MEHAIATATPDAAGPDLQTALYEFNVAAIEIYKDLLCDGEKLASRQLFRSACFFSEALAGVLHAETDQWRTAGAFEARRKIQECLYWLWLLDERGQIAGHQYRDAAFTNALFMHEALTGMVVEDLEREGR